MKRFDFWICALSYVGILAAVSAPVTVSAEQPAEAAALAQAADWSAGPIGDPGVVVGPSNSAGTAGRPLGVVPRVGAPMAWPLPADVEPAPPPLHPRPNGAASTSPSTGSFRTGTGRNLAPYPYAEGSRLPPRIVVRAPVPPEPITHGPTAMIRPFPSAIPGVGAPVGALSGGLGTGGLSTGAGVGAGVGGSSSGPGGSLGAGVSGSYGTWTDTGIGVNAGMGPGGGVGPVPVAGVAITGPGDAGGTAYGGSNVRGAAGGGAAPGVPVGVASEVQVGAQSIQPGPSMGVRSGNMVFMGSGGAGLADNGGATNLPRNTPDARAEGSIGAATNAIPGATSGPAGGTSLQPQPTTEDIAASNDWRYRFHEGRWWYRMPDNHWVYYGNRQWVEFPTTARNGVAASNEPLPSEAGYRGPTSPPPR